MATVAFPALALPPSGLAVRVALPAAAAESTSPSDETGTTRARPFAATAVPRPALVAVAQPAGVSGTSLFGADPFSPAGPAVLWTVAAAARREIGPAAMRSGLTALPAVTALPSLAAAVAVVADQSAPSLIATVPLNNLPFSVALLPNGTRAYVTGASQDYETGSITGLVSVIDTATNRITATIALPDGVGPVAVAIVPNGTRAYVTGVREDYETGSIAGSVSVIDTATNRITATIALPDRLAPYSVAIAPNGTRAYVASIIWDFETGNQTGAVSVIDTATNRITDMIELSSSPTSLAVAPNSSKFYVTTTESDAYGGEASSAVLVVDAATNRVTTSIALPLGTVPTLAFNGLALSPDGTRAYVSSSAEDYFGGSITGVVSVINTSTNQIASTVELPVAAAIPTAVRFSADGRRAFVATITDQPGGDYISGALSVVDTATGQVVATTELPNGVPLGLALKSDGSRAYVVSAGNLQGDAGGSLSILDTSSPPVITGISVGTPSGTKGVVTGTVTANDPDKGRITFTATTSTKGTVKITAAGAFTYTPTATARHAAARVGASYLEQTDTVTVTVTDATGASTSQAVTVPISGTNSAPTARTKVASPNAATGVVTGTVTGSDADKDALTYSTSGLSAKGGTVSLNAATGAFTYTPTATSRHTAAKTGAPSAAKSDTFTVTVADGYGGSNVVTVTVSISPQNTAPTATGAVSAPDPVTGTVTGIITAFDTDGDNLSYKASKAPNGTVVINADGSFTYTPTAGARTSARSSAKPKTDTFTVTVTDGYGGSKAVSVTATIAPKNSAPVAGTVAVGTPDLETGVVTGTVRATDPDKDPLTYDAPTGATKGYASFNASTGVFTYTPTSIARTNAARTDATTADKTDTFSVTVTDKYGASISIPVTVPIGPADAIVIPIGKAPFSVLFSPDGRWVYTAVSGDNAVAVLDAATNTIVRTIRIGDPTCRDLCEGPYFLANSPDGSRLYATGGLTPTFNPDGSLANYEGRSPLTVIDTATGLVTDRYDIGWAEGQLATSPDGKKIYLGLSSWVRGQPAGLKVLEFDTGIISYFGLSSALVLPSADGREVLLKDWLGDGRVSNFDVATNSQIWSNTLTFEGRKYYGRALATGNGRVYVSVAESAVYSPASGVAVLDATTGNFIALIKTSARGIYNGTPEGLAVSPDGKWIFLAEPDSNTLAVIDAGTNTLHVTKHLEGFPFGVTVSPDSKYVYVTDRTGGTLSVMPV